MAQARCRTDPTYDSLRVNNFKVRDMEIYGDVSFPSGEFKKCICFGVGAEPNGDDSVVIATGPNKFLREDSNINFAHVMEANSSTLGVLFPGLVESVDGFGVPEGMYIGLQDSCDVCQVEKSDLGSDSVSVPGVEWKGDGFIGHLCFDCIRSSAMHWKAMELGRAYGDPLESLRKSVADLSAEVVKLREELNMIRSANEKNSSIE